MLTDRARATSSPAALARRPASAGVFQAHPGHVLDRRLRGRARRSRSASASAVYLEEYASDRAGSPGFIDVNIRNLAGVPSIVYGILGLAIFVQALEAFTGGRTLMAAGITLAILVLPIVIITAAEAIRAVPDALREAGFGVGATRWEVIRTPRAALRRSRASSPAPCSRWPGPSARRRR